MTGKREEEKKKKKEKRKKKERKLIEGRVSLGERIANGYQSRKAGRKVDPTRCRVIKRGVSRRESRGRDYEHVHTSFVGVVSPI